MRHSSDDWKSTKLSTEADVFDSLEKLHDKRWLFRGQSSHHSLLPPIDRPPLDKLPRVEKLKRERQSIDLLRETARHFSHPGEEGGLINENIALAVLRHYGVPTRLLDWSRSPFVAMFFAVCGQDKEDGEIWSFDERLYAQNGKEQWRQWPETTIDHSGDDDKFKAEMTEFIREEPPDWFVCMFYPQGFPRQHAQKGAYSLTARFGRNHAEMIALILQDESRHHRYVIPADLKSPLQKALRERHGIWRGSLFPDAAGAAETAKKMAFPEV